jgi:hypothetical protein
MECGNLRLPAHFWATFLLKKGRFTRCQTAKQLSTNRPRYTLHILKIETAFCLCSCMYMNFSCTWSFLQLAISWQPLKEFCLKIDIRLRLLIVIGYSVNRPNDRLTCYSILVRLTIIQFYFIFRFSFWMRWAHCEKVTSQIPSKLRLW